VPPEVGSAPAAETEPVPEPSPSVPAPAGAVGAVPARILALQSAAGNRAVSQWIARSPRVLARQGIFDMVQTKIDDAKAGKYVDPKIQAVYDRNKPGTENQRLALAWLDWDPASAPSGKWTKLSWSKIAEQAAERVFHPNLISQKQLGVCDMAAVLNFEATVDPKGYAELAWECFTQGKVKGKSLNSTLLGNDAMAGQDEVDWMLLSAMTDTTNDWYSYYGRPDPEKPKWSDAKREGFLAGDDKWALKTFGGALETKVLDTPEAADVIPATKTANDLLRAHPDEIAVLVRLSASVLQNPGSDENNLNHTVRLTKPALITEDPDPTKGTVKADFFTWGNILSWSGTERQYQHMVYAYVLASRTKGLL
jgi:hypothetical protein